MLASLDPNVLRLRCVYVGLLVARWWLKAQLWMLTGEWPR